jgi:hypothetical protein
VGEGFDGGMMFITSCVHCGEKVRLTTGYVPVGWVCPFCNNKGSLNPEETVTAPLADIQCARCKSQQSETNLMKKIGGDYLCPACVQILAERADKVTFTSGAQSSGVMPAYHLCPFDDFLPRLAARYQLGRDKGYALDNWRKGLEDDAYVADRLNHGLQHMMNAVQKITRGDYTNGEDDDLAGAMWAIVFGMAAQKARGGVK